MTPTARTLAECRKLGFTAEVVEHRVPGSRFVFTRDLFNVIDVLALEPGRPGVLGIQTTTRSNASARLKKIHDEPRAELFLACQNRLELWTWAKQGARGKRKVWTLKREPISPLEMAASPPTDGIPALSPATPYFGFPARG